MRTALALLLIALIAFGAPMRFRHEWRWGWGAGTIALASIIIVTAYFVVPTLLLPIAVLTLLATVLALWYLYGRNS
ncbi:hypothetical protein IPA_06095 [Ignicoccus pacificus DSM 13166]|uniref:Uncharacterized protein n=1 Tax=Ignicoccus pacificus DSM 13166 TaxID=940294 RepID=A0A977PLI6_9CREN|nr:hypothetical protein IPA_06095 [Ignicoccus pacificus DSM 13166]